jgi:NADH:ubiquinone oxidoreductase subunit 3 (subunit A)
MDRIEGFPMDAAAPSASYLASHGVILSFLAVTAGFVATSLLLWKLLRPSRFSEEKLTTYECGESPRGSAWVQFNIRFYVFALIFVIFDVEAVFLLPWAVAYRSHLAEGLGPLVYAEVLLFVAILLVALVYVWRKGDLEWVRAEDRR